VQAVSSVTIRGTLAHHAEARITATHPLQAWIYCEVITGACDAPVHVRYRVPGLGYAAEISAKTKADQMRRGVRVYARGEGLRMARGGLVLTDVEQLVLAEESALQRRLDVVAP
jgi:hypothetical protein